MKLKHEPTNRKQVLEDLQALNDMPLAARVRMLITRLTNNLCEKQPIKHDED